MNARRTLLALLAIVFLIGGLAPDARSRGRRGGSGKGKVNVVELKWGERMSMPARGWISVRVDKPNVVRAVLNSRRGRVTLIPKRRGKTMMEFKMTVPRLTKPVKGKMLLVVK